MRAPIVEDQQLDAGELVDQSWEAAVETGERQIFEEPGHADIENGIVEPRGLSSDGRRRDRFCLFPFVR